MSGTLNAVYGMYDKIKLGTCEKCQQCQEQMNNEQLIGPVPIYHVGEEFQNDRFKIFFIGQVAYGWTEFIKTSTDWKTLRCDDKFKNRVYELFQTDESRFWGVLRRICFTLYGSIEEGWKRIAVSNMMHCNRGTISSKLPDGIRKNCAHHMYGLHVAEMEAQALSPNSVIVLTTTEGGYLNEWDYAGKIEWITNNKCKEGLSEKGTRFKILHHPSGRHGLGLADYDKEISAWVREGK